ncbi:hypothetical protein JCM5350_007312 [Sporobolomyces pararoseus]
MAERKWRSDFQHRLLILVARLQVEVQSQPEAYDTEGYQLSEERMNELEPLMDACDLIPTSDPNETNLEIFNKIMFNLFGFAGHFLDFEYSRETIGVE